MDTPRALILWVGGAAGIMLIYSGIKGDSPLTEFKKWFGPSSSTPLTNTNATGTGDGYTPDTTDLGMSGIGGYTGNTTATGEYGSTDLSGLSGQTVSLDTSSGSYFTYDANGNPVTEVPPVYQASPATYIPPVGAVSY